ncbi:hypothetical protein AVEN_254079-1 [Araneus ventricosus]|uniref:DUF4817 domain-containing protein n=1 Tax=Araneus ventricosus TaxID=182803 RepID=A0A4Y2BZV5_ARAVE|nr:hypothetical protein AVEN_254079-1 [Araneus ventricosus]
MWTPQEKAQCVAWFIETKSDTKVQRNFRNQYGREPPSRPTIPAWYMSFMETGSVLHKQGVVTHLFQPPTLHLGIGLCLYKPGYTLSFLLRRPHFFVKLRQLEIKKT